MSDKLRQAIISLTWPGPIAGPLPITLFRLLSPVLVFYLHAFLAALIMSLLTAFLSVGYFKLLELTGGREWTEGLLLRLPSQTSRGFKTRGTLALFFTSILIGVFPYAIFLKLLKYPQGTSKLLLVTAAILSSFIWTGFFWGSAVEIAKTAFTFAF